MPLKESFLKGFAEKADSDSTVKVRQIIEDATSYGFCEAHAVCVALDFLYGAYVKAHYPLEYLCFTDLLYDMETHPAFDSQVIKILIRLGCFREFGTSGKL